jgi:hypothetical protein
MPALLQCVPAVEILEPANPVVCLRLSQLFVEFLVVALGGEGRWGDVREQPLVHRDYGLLLDNRVPVRANPRAAPACAQACRHACMSAARRMTSFVTAAAPHFSIWQTTRFHCFHFNVSLNSVMGFSASSSFFTSAVT